MSSFAVSVRTVFFECPLRWFLRPAGASLSRWSSSSALRTRSASAFFSSSKSPSLLKTSFGSRPSRSWSRVSFLIAISALRRRHYGPAHKIPDSPGGEFGRHGEPTRLQVDEELPPALGALTRADLEADEFLLALRRGADNHQHAFRDWLHAGLEVDPVGPDVDVAAGRQVTATPSVVFALPGRRQPPDHRRREVRRVLAEQARERLLEVASRDAPQVEDGQERIEALRPTRPARQDHGREPDLLRLGHVGSVAHLGPLHLQGADPGLDPPHRPVPVSDDPLAPVRKCDAGMLRHEGVRLHPHGYGQHPPRSLARDLRQWIIDRIDLAEWDNGSSLLHGVSFLREVLAVFATATIRRLLTLPSPISPHSSAGPPARLGDAKEHEPVDSRRWADRR